MQDIELLPALPEKDHFTVAEVVQLTGIKAHVLRYWEQEFQQLRPHKRRGDRRYYRQEDVLLVFRIKRMLFDEGLAVGQVKEQLLVWQTEGMLIEETWNIKSSMGASKPHDLQEIILTLQDVLDELS